MLSHRDSDYVGKFTSNLRILEICQQQQAASSSKLPTEIAEYPITRRVEVDLDNIILNPSE